MRIPAASASCFRRHVLAGLVASLALLTSISAHAADTIYLLTTDAKLSTAVVTAASSFSAPVAITGVAVGETLVAIDVRPQNQRLYALGVNATTDTATLYCISIETNLATAVGNTGGIAFTTDGATAVDFPDPAVVDWDIDFNPGVDRLRVVAGSLNFRVNPNSGAPVEGDQVALGINPDGAVNGGTTTLGGAGYSNNFPDTDGNTGNNFTTLYTVDAGNNGIYIQSPPNGGTTTLQGTFKDIFTDAVIDVSRIRGFDIPPGPTATADSQPVSNGGAYMVAQVGSSTFCYSVNLNSGNVGKLQKLDGEINLSVRSIAVRTTRGSATALTGDGAQLTRFDVTSPSTLSKVSVGALNSGEQLVAIDARPATGQLYGFGVNATANTGTLYLIDPQVGTVTAVGTPGQIAFQNATATPVDFPDPATGYGMDFNPTVDRVRIVTGSGLNFRLNPITGAPVDTNSNSADGTNPDSNLNSGTTRATATAYTNNFGGATATTQYAYDSTTGNLFIQNPPNAGTETFLGNVFGTNFDAFGVSGFDIPSSVSVATSNATASGFGWILSGRAGSFTQLYRVDLTSGSGAQVGVYGDNRAAAGLVIWATTPDIAVQSEGSVVTDGGTVDFGTVAGAPVLTRTLTIRNNGSQPLTYSAQPPFNGAFSITQGSAGSIAGGGSATLVVDYAPGAGTDTDFLAIYSDDPDSSTLVVNLTGPGYLPLTADKAVSTSGETRLQPLANDELGAAYGIVGVSDSSITFSGRTLIIPAGYFGTFTYDVSNGTLTGRGQVTVTAGTAAIAPLKFTGVITDATGNVAGMATVAVNTKGVASTTMLLGTAKVSKKLTFSTGVDTANGTVKFGTPAGLGSIDLDRSISGTMAFSFRDPNGGSYSGTLHAAAAPVAAAKTYYIALSSIDPTIPGGAFVTATVSKAGLVKIAGTLPDGHAITAGTFVTDQGKIPCYAVDKASKPAATYGGELTIADLTKTDLTGELVWVKPGQLPTVKGPHLLGEDTVLLASGSLYDGLTALPTGNGTLKLTGGNLAADESNMVAISTLGVPAVPTGALTSWTGVTLKAGKFAAKVTVPGITKPVVGKGIYLPKSNRAWGFFPGTTIGGRIELTVP